MPLGMRRPPPWRIFEGPEDGAKIPRTPGTSLITAPHLANLMKNPFSKVAFLNDQNTFLVVTCPRLPFRSVGSGWQWISEGLNCVIRF